MKEETKISEKELDDLYLYLYMNIDNMDNEEIAMWKKVLEEIDPNFYEDKSDDPGRM